MIAAWERLTDRQKKELEKEVQELFDWERDQCEQLRERLMDEGRWVGGLDSNQKDYAPIIAERNQRFRELQKKYGFK